MNAYSSPTTGRRLVPGTAGRSVREASVPLCLTAAAAECLLETVGRAAPETGAKCFGPAASLGVDTVEFDEAGSRRASGAVYSPDVAWGEARCQFWLAQSDSEMRLWTGDAHSHPGQLGYPSHKAGKALGDLGYVEEVFATNETMQYFFLPILTNTGRKSETVTIMPWVVERDDPQTPTFSSLAVCEAAEFPVRTFNPAWREASSIDGVAPPSPASEAPLVEPSHPATLDLDKFVGLLAAECIGSRLASSDSFAIELRVQGVGLLVILPPGFPRSKPRVLVLDDDSDWEPFTFQWRVSTPLPPHHRLAALCLAAIHNAIWRF